MPARPKKLTPELSARHMFGAELRRKREEAGMSLESLGAVIRYSKSSLARYETAESMIPPDLPALLDAAFGTSDGWFGKLYALAVREFHPVGFHRMLELEARCRLIEEYSGQLVPGLVQTAGYARGLFEVHNPKDSPEENEERVRTRLGRRLLLDGEHAPDVWLILDEAALRCHYGTPEDMREQFTYLIDNIETRNLVIQVLPFSFSGNAMAGGSTKLMTLENDTQVIWEESSRSGTLTEDKQAVRERYRAYALARAHALSPKESAALIHAYREALPS